MMKTDNKRIKEIIILAIIVILGATFLYYKKQNQPNNVTTTETYLKPLVELTALSSQEDKATYVEAVRERAKKVDSLEIGSCNPDPKIVQVNFGEAIDFSNSYIATRTISFSPAHTFEIAPQEKRTIVFNFFDFPGVLEYKCDYAPVGKVFQIKTDQI